MNRTAWLERVSELSCVVCGARPAAGGTLKDVQEVLGHKSVATSNRYAHMLLERKRTVLDLALQPVKAEKKEGAA